MMLHERFSRPCAAVERPLRSEAGPNELVGSLSEAFAVRFLMVSSGIFVVGALVYIAMTSMSC